MISEEVRELTSEVNCIVFRCDGGCGNEIVCRRTTGYPVRDAVSEWSESVDWFEIASASVRPGPTFCSWACIAIYAAKAAERDTAELIAA